MIKLQRKLHNIYLIYKDLYPEEYVKVVEQISARRAQMIDQEFGTLTGKNKATERLLGEMPEKLYNLITIKLDENELKEFATKKVSQSFYKRHPEFLLVKSV